MSITNELLRVLASNKGTIGGAPNPTKDPESIVRTLNALKEMVETMNGSRGRAENRMITVLDLANILELLVPYLLEEVRKEFHP